MRPLKIECTSEPFTGRRIRTRVPELIYNRKSYQESGRRISVKIQKLKLKSYADEEKYLLHKETTVLYAVSGENGLCICKEQHVLTTREAFNPNRKLVYKAEF